MVIVSADISERKAIEADLLRQKNLVSLLENNPVHCPGRSRENPR